MSTKHKDIFEALAARFDPREEKVLPKGGRKLTYITARTAMIRLDEVLGPENWWDEYTSHENMVLCRLTLRLPDGREVTKSDAGGHAGMQDSGDDEKSAFSDAFKRACFKWGIGRYLYGDGFADLSDGAQAEVKPAPQPEAPKAKPAVPIARLAKGVAGEAYREFRAWLETLIKAEDERLEKLARDDSGELPLEWTSPANGYRLVNHLINWLNDLGFLSQRSKEVDDNGLKARAVAYAWAKDDPAFQAEFDAEIEAWRDKLAAEATAWRSKPPAKATSKAG